jgi:glucokinase
MTAGKSANISTALVGDFGGTNARFALADVSGKRPVISQIREYPSKNFKSGGDAVRTFLTDVGAQPAVAVIAVAGPITDGAVHFTNIGWTFSEDEILHLGFAKAQLLNDFEALALSTQHIVPEKLKLLGETQKGQPNATVAVMGPGTGFGASALVRARGHAIALAAEAGHASFAPVDDVESQILRFLANKYGSHISIERVLSGPGLQNLHEALNAIEGISGAVPQPHEITQGALSGDASCVRTVKRFCAIMGSVAGNLALTYGARGGLYIAGGISPLILPILEQSDFRARFEAKGRFTSYVAAIPTQVILDGYAAFLGTGDQAHRLAQQLAAS